MTFVKKYLTLKSVYIPLKRIIVLKIFLHAGITKIKFKYLKHKIIITFDLETASISTADYFHHSTRLW